LTTSVHEAEKLSLDQIEAFLKASEGIRFEGETQEQVYHWIEQVLCQQQYHQQSRQARGLVRRCSGPALAIPVLWHASEI
jgi:UDP:flavonoid glycosyltransferase YjiC (YdhE family)